MPLPRHCEALKGLWQSVSPRIEDGFPRQRARWLGMTGGNYILQHALALFHPFSYAPVSPEQAGQALPSRRIFLFFKIPVCV